MARPRKVEVIERRAILRGDTFPEVMAKARARRSQPKFLENWDRMVIEYEDNKRNSKKGAWTLVYVRNIEHSVNLATIEDT